MSRNWNVDRFLEIFCVCIPYHKVKSPGYDEYVVPVLPARKGKTTQFTFV